MLGAEQHHGVVVRMRWLADETFVFHIWFILLSEGQAGVMRCRSAAAHLLPCRRGDLCPLHCTLNSTQVLRICNGATTVVIICCCDRAQSASLYVGCAAAAPRLPE
jgi:hypothetical protein